MTRIVPIAKKIIAMEIEKRDDVPSSLSHKCTRFLALLNVIRTAPESIVNPADLLNEISRTFEKDELKTPLLTKLNAWLSPSVQASMSSKSDSEKLTLLATMYSGHRKRPAEQDAATTCFSKTLRCTGDIPPNLFQKRFWQQAENELQNLNMASLGSISAYRDRTSDEEGFQKLLQGFLTLVLNTEQQFATQEKKAERCELLVKLFLTEEQLGLRIPDTRRRLYIEELADAAKLHMMALDTNQLEYNLEALRLIRFITVSIPRQTEDLNNEYRDSLSQMKAVFLDELKAIIMAVNSPQEREPLLNHLIRSGVITNKDMDSLLQELETGN